MLSSMFTVPNLFGAWQRMNFRRNNRLSNTRRIGRLNIQALQVQWQTPQTSEPIMPSINSNTSLDIGAMFVPRGDGNPSKKIVPRQPLSRHKSSPSTKVVHMPGTTTMSPRSLSMQPLETTGHACALRIPCLTMHRRRSYCTHLGPRCSRPQALTLCGHRSSPNS